MEAKRVRAIVIVSLVLLNSRTAIKYALLHVSLRKKTLSIVVAIA